MKHSLIFIVPFLLLAQSSNVRKPKLPDKPSGLPCTVLKGVQSTQIPDSEGGGEHIVLQTEHGLIGPFLKLPSLPAGVGYASTEVGVPGNPQEPCRRGNWAKDDQYLYMCIAVDPKVNSTGTIWRRVMFDPAW